MTKRPKKAKASEPMVSVPVVGEIGAGDVVTFYDQVTERISIPVRLVENPPPRDPPEGSE